MPWSFLLLTPVLVFLPRCLALLSRRSGHPGWILLRCYVGEAYDLFRNGVALAESTENSPIQATLSFVAWNPHICGGVFRSSSVHCSRHIKVGCIASSLENK